MAVRTNSSIISNQAKALSVGITTQRDGLTRINNALDNATNSTEAFSSAIGCNYDSNSDHENLTSARYSNLISHNCPQGP